MNTLSPSRHRSAAFTLVELMVATVVLVIILLVLVSMVNQTATIWRTSSAKVEQFRSARTAFESITRHLSQATLNTYYDYYKDEKQIPRKYIRQSDLRFICGSTKDLIDKNLPSSGKTITPGPGHAVFFNAPLGFVSGDLKSTDPKTGKTISVYSGLGNLLNTWGYFIEYGSDYNYRPSFLNVSGGGFTAPPERYRYRLMEFMVPSDQITIYRYTSAPMSGDYYKRFWIEDFLKLPLSAPSGSTDTQLRPAHLLAENIVTLVIYPQLSVADQKFLQTANPPSDPAIAPGYTYDTTPSQENPTKPPKGVTAYTDSTNQLPPVVQVTMVALDEASAARVERQQNGGGGGTPPSKLNGELLRYFTSAPIGEPHSEKTAVNYSNDLIALQKYLVSERLAYRTFTSNVSLRSAKWSRN